MLIVEVTGQRLVIEEAYVQGVFELLRHFFNKQEAKPCIVVMKTNSSPHPSDVIDFQPWSAGLISVCPLVIWFG